MVCVWPSGPCRRRSVSADIREQRRSQRRRSALCPQRRHAHGTDGRTAAGRETRQNHRREKTAASDWNTRSYLSSISILHHKTQPVSGLKGVFKSLKHNREPSDMQRHLYMSTHTHTHTHTHTLTVRNGCLVLCSTRLSVTVCATSS